MFVYHCNYRANRYIVKDSHVRMVHHIAQITFFAQCLAGLRAFSEMPGR